MPWGEFIPFADWFPWYRRLLLAWIPQISEFTPGTEYSVFPVAEGLRLAPMICYDATQVPVAQGMAANGANVALVLANLAWFGPTTASMQFEQVIRFRAIENRMPVLFASQSGRTVYFDARGEPAGKFLPAFQTGALTVEVSPPNLRAVFTYWGTWIERLYALTALGLVGLLFWRPRRP
jgi:apolipoprotein N-acyltransferase